FPARSCSSLSHVRFTPQQVSEQPPSSAFEAMRRDAARFLPAAAAIRHKGSLWEKKTLLRQNDDNDGRPILLHSAAGGSVLSVLGAKIDNVFDITDELLERL